MRGRNLDSDANPISGTKIEVWQATDEGIYDVQHKGHPTQLHVHPGDR